MMAYKPTKNGRRAFTLAELLVAMLVTSIVLSAVVSLAYALGTANDATNDTSRKQAQVRYATVRISELIRHSRLICAAPGNDLALWRADDNGNGKINVNELVYIETGPKRDYLRLCEFDSASNPSIKLSYIEALITKWWLKYSCEVSYTRMISQCSNARFQLDVSPPNSRFVSISFDLAENDGIGQYQISSTVRSPAENLLNESADALVTDDD